MSFSKLIYVQIIFIALAVLHGCAFSEDATHILLREARLLELKKNYKKAEEAYNKIDLSEEASSSQLTLAVLVNMSRFYLRTKDYSKAIILCRKAIRLCDKVYGEGDHLELSILFMIASAYEGLGDYEKATYAYKSLYDYEENEAGFAKARELIPLIKLGDIALEHNDLAQAVKHYQSAYASGLIPKPLYRVLCYRIAISCIALGRVSEAESYFKDSLPEFSQDAGDTQLFDDCAELLRNNGKFGGARLVLEKKANWQLQHQKYLDWLSKRVSPLSRFNLLNEFTQNDFSDFRTMAKKTTAVHR